VPAPGLAKPRHGPAFAGGMGLVAACVLVAAADEAEFALPESRIGLVPAMISPYLVRAMARSRRGAIS
jgi:methylglutaconyl-CoA hydratase